MKAYLFILALVMGSVSLASANEVEAPGFYWRLGAGANFLGEVEQGYAYNPDAVFAGTPPSGAVIDPEAGLVATGALGFDYEDGIRTELEYRYSSSALSSINEVGALGGATGPLPAGALQEDLKAHFVFANFYFDLDTGGPVSPFIGAGVGGAFVEAPGLGETDAALAYQGRAGLSYAFDGGFHADLECVFTRSNTLRYGPAVEDFTPTGPFETSIDGDNYQASSVMVSLRRKF